MTGTTPSPYLGTVTVLPVDDIGRAARWYADALGFETIYRHEGDDPTEPTNYAILRQGLVHVHLILDEPHEDRQPWMTAGTGYLYLFVSDVDAVFDDVQRRGVAITRSLQTENWPARGFNLTDPSGNAIHIEQMERCDHPTS